MERDDTINIAVYESMPDEAEFIATELRNAGHAVKPLSFKNSDDLKAILSNNRVDLIYCTTEDKELGSACRIADKHKDHIPVIAISSDTDTAAVIHAMENGARDLVSRNQPAHLRMVTERELKGIKHCKGMYEFKQAYQESEKRCRSLLDSSRDAIAYIHDGMHIYSNNVYVEKFGFEDSDDLEGLPILDLVAIDEHPRFKEFLTNYGKQAGEENVDIRCERDDGTEFEAAMEFSPASIDGEACTQVIIREQSVSQEVINELEILKSQDSVTGLYNRQAFIEEVEQAITDVQNGNRPGVILYIEVDKFDAVKSTMGLENIDNCIATIGKLIASKLKDDDFGARFGEHTFTILVREGDVRKIGAKSKALVKSLNTIVEAKDLSMQVTSSLGLASIRSTTRTPYEIIACADMACNIAKERGGNSIEAYKSPEKEAEKKKTQDDLRWVNLLKNALENNLLKLAFQPVVGLKDESDQIYEVLLRLTDEDGTEILPGEFLPAAEKTGMINLIDRWVIGRALHMLAEKQREGDNTNLFVKLSGSAYTDEGLLPWLYERSKASKIDTNRLIFEVAESDATGHISKVAQFCRTLKKMRCRTLVSQFGMADEPTKLFKAVPIDFVKIHPGLTGQIASDPSMMQAVRELVNEAHEAEKEVIAPHVESADSMAQLFTCGFDFIQGNFLQEPDIVMQFDFSENEASMHRSQAAME